MVYPSSNRVKYLLLYVNGPSQSRNNIYLFDLTLKSKVSGFFSPWKPKVLFDKSDSADNWGQHSKSPSGVNFLLTQRLSREIWWITLKNKRAPLLWEMHLVEIHSWCCTFTYVGKHDLQSRNTQSCSKLVIFCPVTLKFDGWKALAHLFYVISNCVHYSVAICELKLELQSRKYQFGAKFVLNSVTLTFDLDLLHGYNPWKFHDDTVTRTFSKQEHVGDL